MDRARATTHFHIKGSGWHYFTICFSQRHQMTWKDKINSVLVSWHHLISLPSVPTVTNLLKKGSQIYSLICKEAKSFTSPFVNQMFFRGNLPHSCRKNIYLTSFPSQSSWTLEKGANFSIFWLCHGPTQEGLETITVLSSTDFAVIHPLSHPHQTHMS